MKEKFFGLIGKGSKNKYSYELTPWGKRHMGFLSDIEKAYGIEEDAWEMHKLSVPENIAKNLSVDSLNTLNSTKTTYLRMKYLPAVVSSEEFRSMDIEQSEELVKIVAEETIKEGADYFRDFFGLFQRISDNPTAYVEISRKHYTEFMRPMEKE